jgi:cyclopropane fatty-acyl-phospholipid synthase-like methyltransferase
MSLRKFIVQQFKRPNGLLGKLAGHIMANRSSNIERNRWMLELLELKPQDRVLEIGYGPGLAVEGALQRIDKGLVMGIDHSETMFKQASRRVASAIAQGRAKLLLGDIQEHPGFDMPFDHIYSANVVMFWKNPTAVFKYLKTILAPGGDVVTLYMPRNIDAANEDGYKAGDEIANWLKQAGFANIRTEIKEFGAIAAVCVIARNA